MSLKNKRIGLPALIYIIGLLLWNCQIAKDELIRSKNACYDKKFEPLKNTDLYKRLHVAFSDTFAIIQATSPSLLLKRIDDALFLKSDSSECVLIVLERSKDTAAGFGSARIYQGKLNEGRWTFEKSMWFTFGHSYYTKYSTNSFENISEVARYSVLTQGDAKLGGCDIDEYYWFTYLKE